jgi:nucleosome binding factor SPN SPT16 subunit
LSTNETANIEENPSNVLPEESEESVSPESTQITVPEETETDIVEEDLDSEQYLDNSQTNEDSNELEGSGPKNIPAHRMYFEDRRRKKKKR